MSEDEETSSAASGQQEKVAIGISFGNSNSSIAYTHASTGKAEVMANEEGDRQIPSILSYVGGEEFHGTQAKAQLVRNARNTVASFRDFLGKRFGEIDPTPCHASARPVEHEGGVAFHVAEGEDGAEQSTVGVADVATRHLRKLKHSASDYLGRDVTAAVIAIPSNFGDAQRSALAASASSAGIDVLQFIPEPTAALLAYEAKLAVDGVRAAPQDEFLVVADLGGVRSDVAVLAVRGGMYTTLATAHDYELGGAALDAVLVDFAAREFLKKNKAASDPRATPRSLAKLALEAEAVKKSLSQSASAIFSIESLADGLDFSLSINRTRYELLAAKVLGAFTRLIQCAVQKADLDSLDIGTVVLSGGTSHTPKIASNLQTAFPEPHTYIISPSTSLGSPSPSEMAARGAAIQASLIRDFEHADVEQSTHAMVTVTPHLAKAIGVVDGRGAFVVVVEPETPVPVRHTARIAVPAGGDVLVQICEGTARISITQHEKTQSNGKGGRHESDADSDDDDDDDNEPDERREKIWTPGPPLAEAALRGVRKGGKVEVQINVSAELEMTVVCKEVGKAGGVRGTVGRGAVAENGRA